MNEPNERMQEKTTTETSHLQVRAYVCVCEWEKANVEKPSSEW